MIYQNAIDILAIDRDLLCDRECLLMYVRDFQKINASKQRAHPIVKLVTDIYQTGVKLTKKDMEKVENQIQRLPELGKWFVDIFYDSV